MNWTYEWEPVEQTVYEFGNFADATCGLWYDTLHVEETVGGWHGVLFVFDEGDEDTDAAFVMVDEEVFPNRGDAVEWCEDRDKARHELSPRDWEGDEYED